MLWRLETTLGDEFTYNEMSHEPIYREQGVLRLNKKHSLCFVDDQLVVIDASCNIRTYSAGPFTPASIAFVSTCAPHKYQIST